mgnify:CR=1 FL=1
MTSIDENLKKVEEYLALNNKLEAQANAFDRKLLESTRNYLETCIDEYRNPQPSSSLNDGALSDQIDASFASALTAVGCDEKAADFAVLNPDLLVYTIIDILKNKYNPQ